jgi:hypothetical protein
MLSEQCRAIAVAIESFYVFCVSQEAFYRAFYRIGFITARFLTKHLTY